MAGEIASAYVSILPSFKGGGTALTKQLNSDGAAAGDSAGRTAGSRFTGSFGGAISKIGGVIAGAFVVDKAVDFFKGAVSGASDLNETVNKATVIFGAQSPVIRAWASDAAENLGLSQQAALDAAAGFGDMFKQIGFAGDEAANLAKSTVEMSADLGSFNNLPTADVSERISAAFRGEYDSLQLLIPNINAARVQTEAMAMTGKKNASELTAQEKAAAVLAIVNHDGARAIGDFARTSSGAANTSKILAARFADLKARVGQALLPAFQSLLALGGKVVTFFTTGGDKSSAFGKILARVGPIATAAFAQAKAAFRTFIGIALIVFNSVRRFLVDNQAKFAEWGNKIKALVQLVAPLIAGFLRDFVNAVGKKIPAVAAALGKAFIKVGDALAGVIDFVKTSVEFFQQHEGAAVALRAIIVGVTAAFLAYKIAMTAVSLATTVVSAVTKAYAAVQAVLNAVMSANPIAIVVLALVALAAGLVYAYKNSETFRNIVNGAFTAIKNVVGGVIEWITTAVPAAFEFIKQHIAAIALVLFGPLGLAIVELIKHWGEIKSTVVTVFDGVVSFVTGIPQRIKDALGNLLNLLVSAGRDVITGLLNAIIIKAIDVKDWFFALPGVIIGYIGDLGSLLYNAGQSVIQGLIDGIQDKVSHDLIGVLEDVALTIIKHKGPPSRDAVLLRNNGRLIMQGLEDGMKSQLPSIKGFLAGVTGDLATSAAAAVRAPAGTSGLRLDRTTRSLERADSSARPAVQWVNNNYWAPTDSVDAAAERDHSLATLVGVL